MKPSLLLLGLLLSGVATPGATQQSPDITGRWLIEHGASQNGETYGGEVTIQSLGSCYSVEWLLEGGARYTGVGILRAGVLVVAYADPAAGDQYGVVAYAPASAGGFEGSSCRMNGTNTSETLGGPDSLTGAHQISRATGGTGTLAVSPFGGSTSNYRMHWSTTEGEYDGFGTILTAPAPILGGIWGTPQGGVALYSMSDLSNRRLVGLWASMGTTGQGEETLKRP
jgi:hypothetical protein